MMNKNKREEQQQQLVVVVVDSSSLSSRTSSFEQECQAASTNTTDDDTGILSCRDRQSQQLLWRQQQQQPHRRHHHRRRCCPLLLMMMLVLLVLTHGSNKDNSPSSGGNSFVVVEATKAKAKAKKKNNSHHQVEFTLPHVPFHTKNNNRDNNNNNKDGSTPITATTTTTTTPLIDAQELEQFIDYATSYLVQISHTTTQDPHFPGRFTYQAYTHHNLQPSLETPQYWNTPHHQQPDYNLLRHNGALYALSQAYTRSREMERTQKNNDNNNNRSFGVLRSGNSNNGKDSNNNNNNNGKDNNNSNSISSEVILETIQRGIGYLRDTLISPPKNGNKNKNTNNELLLAAWEREDINDPHSTLTTAKLGGAGLALIALGNLHHIDGVHSVSLEKELRPLGAFIESLQNTQDGSFTCKYHWTTGPDDSWQSLYYPGEAALGLVTLAEIESQESIEESDTTVDSSSSSSHKKNNKKNQQRWMTVASQTLLYLERYRRYADLDDIEPDHWALLATAKLLPLLHKQRHHLQHKLTTTTTTTTNTEQEQKQLELQQQKQQLDVEYWLIYNHAIKVATSMVTDHTSIQLQRNHGCFSPDMRTCPTATRLEGLLATLTFLQESELYMGDEGHEGTTTELLQDRIEHDVAMGIRFLLNAQQQTNTNQMRGAVPGKYNPTTKSNTKNRENSGSGSADASSSEEEESEEEEDNLSNEVRVDYVQHSMSAVIAYEAYLLQKEAKAAAKQRNNNDTFQTKVQEKVHGVTDHLKKQMHRGRHTLTTTTKMSETYANVVLVGILLFFVCIILYIVLVPSYLSTQSSKLKKNF